MAYDVPSAASADAGLEGFTVRTGCEQIGHVAALNRIGADLVVVVDTGDGYRALPSTAIERIERLPRVVLLRPGDPASTAPVDVHVVRVETERLVRHIPLELECVSVDGDAPAHEPRSSVWYAGAVLALAGGVGTFVGAPLAVEGLGGSVLRWVWLAVPLAACLAGVVLVRRSGKLGDAAIALVGISPHRHRRR